MKLLLDQNLLRGLAMSLSEDFPGTSHVSDVALSTSSDKEIWDYAQSGGFGILTRDSDFNHLAILKGAPPKVVWLRVGNCSVRELGAFVLELTQVISDFLREPDTAVLVLSRSGPAPAT